MGLFHWFSTPKPKPRIVIKNVLGEVLWRFLGVMIWLAQTSKVLT
jgi:hypothetical protein